MTEPQRTPVARAHERLGARMVDFAGFWMPLQYTSIREEHTAVREAVGLFDVSHMGQVRLEGAAAARAAEQLLTRRITSLQPGQARYALLCNESGGVVDDIMAYRLAADAVALCVNAANIRKDFDWIGRHAPQGVRVRDVSAETGLLAVQGPASVALLESVSTARVALLRRFHFERLEVAGHKVLVSRTGYTGADGFELSCEADQAEPLFEALLERGAPLGIRPVGLGARDTLRLEAALPLYGHELDEETSPLEAGLGRFVELEGHPFLGAEAIRRRAREGLRRRLVGFVLEGRGVARAGYAVAAAGETVGRVTSGAPSPTLGQSIGLAYVPPALAARGTRLDVMIRGRATPALVVETPFVTGTQAGRRDG
ncbi:MAG: glycine cleavage system aminomethyltransferase GcvT [Myxococcales bacterium]|nr:glycine cleavage system aminomethyltransferase GcvT [Myxococcales bacterium]MDH5307687.1 glycine cleavage system aminomethyltransferase GcvT [Myxococcales bacterium]